MKSRQVVLISGGVAPNKEAFYAAVRKFQPELKPEKILFLFPSNTGHHKNQTLRDPKTGGGLGEIAKALSGTPVLGLPTKNVSSDKKALNVTKADVKSGATASIPPLVKSALIDIWQVLGATDLVPVIFARKRLADSKYFTNPLAVDPTMELSMFGKNEPTPNIPLGDLYQRQVALMDWVLQEGIEGMEGQLEPEFIAAYKHGLSIRNQVMSSDGKIVRDPLDPAFKLKLTAAGATAVAAAVPKSAAAAAVPKQSAAVAAPKPSTAPAAAAAAPAASAASAAATASPAVAPKPAAPAAAAGAAPSSRTDEKKSTPLTDAVKHPAKASFRVIYEIFASLDRQRLARSEIGALRKLPVSYFAPIGATAEDLASAAEKRKVATPSVETKALMEERLRDTLTSHRTRYTALKQYFEEKIRSIPLENPLVFFDDNALRIDIGYDPKKFAELFPDFTNVNGVFHKTLHAGDVATRESLNAMLKNECLALDYVETEEAVDSKLVTSSTAVPAADAAAPVVTPTPTAPTAAPESGSTSAAAAVGASASAPAEAADGKSAAPSAGAASTPAPAAAVTAAADVDLFVLDVGVSGSGAVGMEVVPRSAGAGADAKAPEAGASAAPAPTTAPAASDLKTGTAGEETTEDLPLNSKSLSPNQLALRKAIYAADPARVNALLSTGNKIALTHYEEKDEARQYTESALNKAINYMLYFDSAEEHYSELLSNLTQIAIAIINTEGGCSTFFQNQGSPPTNSLTLLMVTICANTTNIPLRDAYKKITTELLAKGLVTQEEMRSVLELFSQPYPNSDDKARQWCNDLLARSLAAIVTLDSKIPAGAGAAGTVVRPAAAPVVNGAAAGTVIGSPAATPAVNGAARRSSASVGGADDKKGVVATNGRASVFATTLTPAAASAAAGAGAAAAPASGTTTAVLHAASTARVSYNRPESYIANSNLSKIETALNKDQKTPWQMNHSTKDQGYIDVFEGTKKKCTLYAQHITTEDKEVESFKRILLAHYAVHKPGVSKKIPKITTICPEVWERAYAAAAAQLKSEGITAQPEIQIVPVPSIDLSKFNLKGPPQAEPVPSTPTPRR